MTRLSSHPGLRANDGLQHEIEIYLRHCGWFYDRRNNHWENDGKPAERVVEIVYLAQAVLAVCLADPAAARACRSSLLQADASYYRIFDPQRKYSIYLWAATTQKSVDAFLCSQDDVTREEAIDLRFHLTTLLVAEALGRRVNARNCNDVAALVNRTFTSEEMRATLAKLRESMASYRIQTGLATDRVAKSSEFVDMMLIDHLSRPDLRLVVGGRRLKGRPSSLSGAP